MRLLLCAIRLCLADTAQLQSRAAMVVFARKLGSLAALLPWHARQSRVGGVDEHEALRWRSSLNRLVRFAVEGWIRVWWLTALAERLIPIHRLLELASVLLLGAPSGAPV